MNTKEKQTYIKRTKKTSLKATRIFKNTELSDGDYKWNVTETTSGKSTNTLFFTIDTK